MPAPAEPSRGAAPKRARQLLGIEPAEERDDGVPPVDSVAEEVRPTQEPLRFTLQVACLAGRWLVIVVQERAPDASQEQLLANLLEAAAIDIGPLPAFEAFRWPPMENLPVEAPLEEARQGLMAFIEGTRRRGWAPERILVFGGDDALERLLGSRQGACKLLGLPGWRGPALAELMHSAPAKRALWPTLQAWRQAWARPGGEADD